MLFLTLVLHFCVRRPVMTMCRAVSFLLFFFVAEPPPDFTSIMFLYFILPEAYANLPNTGVQAVNCC